LPRLSTNRSVNTKIEQKTRRDMPRTKKTKRSHRERTAAFGVFGGSHKKLSV
jgi:hypothetical protein